MRRFAAVTLLSIALAGCGHFSSRKDKGDEVGIAAYYLPQEEKERRSVLVRSEEQVGIPESMCAIKNQPYQKVREEMMRSAREQGQNLAVPIRYKLKYTLKVGGDCVPDGTNLRAWLPYPRTDAETAYGVELLSSSGQFRISSDEYPNKSIYMEEKAEQGKPTIFSYEVALTVVSKWHDLDSGKVRQWDIASDIYAKYTDRTDPRLYFSPAVTRLADSLTAGTSDPYLKVRSLYTWISQYCEWEPASDWTFVDDIADTVLLRRRADVTGANILFVSMARSCGIPSRWQSGWRMYGEDIAPHSWAEVYYEGIGWVPVDVSLGRALVDRPVIVAVKETPEAAEEETPTAETKKKQKQPSRKGGKKDSKKEKVKELTEEEKAAIEKAKAEEAERIAKEAALAARNHEDAQYFYLRGMDSFRFPVNNDLASPLWPPKKHFRSGTIDFSLGEVESDSGNLYYDQWSAVLEIEAMEYLAK